MTSHTPFQLFKLDKPTGSVSEFNALPPQQSLKYKLKAAEEKITVLVGPNPSEPMSSSSRASVAKALGDYFGLLAQDASLPQGEGNRAKSKSRGRSASRDTSQPFLHAALRVVEVQGVQWSTAEEVATTIQRVKDAETTFRKSARTEPVAEEGPVRKSARIQSQREAAAAAAAAAAAVEPTISSQEKQQHQASPSPDTKVSRTSKKASTIPPSPIVPLLTTPLMTLPELSNALSVMGEDELNDAAPQPQPPEQITQPLNAEESQQDMKTSAPRKSARRSAAPSAVPINVDELTSGTPAQPAELAPKEKKSTRPIGSSARVTKTQKTLFNERRPALIPSEKKFIRALEDMLELIAVEFSTHSNDLLKLFDILRSAGNAAQTIMDKELSINYGVDHDITKPIPFHNISVCLQTMFGEIDRCRRQFENNVEECQSEFDEYILHPVAHAITVVLNTLEGFQSQAAIVQSEKDKETKRKAREAEREKKEEALRKQQQKIREKEEAISKKIAEKKEAIQRRSEAASRNEAEKQLLRNMGKPLDLLSLVEDTTLIRPNPLGFVHYPALPLPPHEYERALFVWSMLTSVPRPLMLSQFPFATFITSLKENKSDNGLMMEIFTSLNDVCLQHYHAVVQPAEGTPKINTRGRDWFSVAIEFIGITSGQKKQKAKKAPVYEASSSSGEDDDDDDTTSDDDDEDDDDDEEEFEYEEEEEAAKKKKGDSAEAAAAAANVDATAANEEAAATEAPAANLTPQEKAIIKTMAVIAELRTHASWGNIDVEDRLNILTYLTQYMLETDIVREEAERLFKQIGDEDAAYEKKLSDARQEAEKELRAIVKMEAQAKKPVPLGGAQPVKQEDFEKKKHQIVAKMESLIREARISKYTKADLEDRGARIVPLGTDRYHRMYWRMPLDKQILVQSLPGLTQEFPVLPPPELPAAAEPASRRRGVLIDEEEDAPKKRARGDTSSTLTTPGTNDLSVIDAQRSWGVIRPEYLPQFVDSLESNTRREGPLKVAMQPLQDYLKHLEAPHEGVRMTRSRAAAHGYLNKLRQL